MQLNYGDSYHANALVESGANDTKQFTEIVSEEKVITVDMLKLIFFNLIAIQT